MNPGGPQGQSARWWRGADGAALVAALLVGVGLAFALREQGFDDPYITYRYAENLASGHGFVYNPGEQVLSTTAPLYALLLAPFAALGLHLPYVSNTIACLGFGLGGLALYRMGRLWGTPAAGGAAGLIFALFPGVLNTVGSEIGLFLALVLWGFAAVAGGRPALAAALLALATLVRADGAVAMAVAGMFVVLTRPPPAAPVGDAPGYEAPTRPDPVALPAADAPGEGAPIPDGAVSAAGGRLILAADTIRHPLRALPWGAAGLYVAMLAPWFLFAWGYFGSPLPATLAAKQRQALLPESRLFLEGLLEYLGYYWAAPLYRALLILAAAGLIYGLWRGRPWLLPIGWGLLMAAAYTLLGVNAYFWYFAQPFTALAAAMGLGAHAAAALARRWGRRPAQIALAALIGLALLAAGDALRYQLANPDARLAVYRSAGEWLAANTAPDDTVGMLEVGVIGFYSRRPIVDFAGLIQPDVAAQFALVGDGGYLGAAGWAIDRYRPAWLVLGESFRPAVEAHPERAARCAVAATIADPGGRLDQTIYRCSW